MIKKVFINSIDSYKPLLSISVAMAVYNGEGFIFEQLSSIFNQTMPPNEIVISDDGSTDNTVEIIKSFKSKYDKKNIIKLIFNDSIKKGHVNNFLNACINTIGDIVFFSDQDDVWLKSKISMMVNAMIKYNLTSVHSNEFYTDKELRIGNYYDYMHRNFILYNDRVFYDCHMYIFDFHFMIMNKFEPNGCCMCFKKGLIDYFVKYIQYCKILKPFGQDYIVFYIAGIVGKCGFLNMPLIKRRIHGKNVMGKVNTKFSIHNYFNYIFKRKKYLYDFIYYLNKTISIRKYIYYRMVALFGVHMFKWIFYCVYKNFIRIMTLEYKKKVV